ncbi:Hpt domain-containing protein [Dyella sp. A6]|uniref:Hpt domain-containing protein n=1 Tax=Dyella aluminiiresistens TaxID=3069105 RepID=UPI002E77DDC2|nr:Hpt domain-containing protein [Dyella sp. A6]
MRLQDNIDFTTLQWVKPELDETFGLARQALEAYVDNPGDREVMRSCADNLHQVQGTLRMVELYGAAMVAEEMETLTISLLEDHVAHREEAYAALMRGLMQLPDYLERLSSGHRDVPVVLLPLLNELRASRAKEALNESALFTPNLGAALPPQAPVAASAEDAARRHGEVAELRLRFQQQLLAWFRGQGAQQQLTGMRNTLNAIAARCVTIPGRRLWWIAAGVLEGLDQGMLKNHAAEVRQLIGKVDRSIRQLIENGEDSLAGGDADELAHKLLYIVAQAKQRSPQMALVAQTYGLDGMLPDAGELEHARGSMTGHNRALLDSVSRALKDDLLRVKDALDLYLRQQSDDPSRLAEQTEVLDRVGDTLGMLALAVPRRVVTEQRRVLADIANRTRVADEETLLDVAGALLYVEASLDDHIESLGAENDRPTPTEEAPTTMLPRSEARHILATLMGEAIANTAKVKDAIVAFVESGWQHAQLANASALMEEVAGAMRMLSSSRSASIAEGIGRFIGNELEIDQRVPTSVQMDHLADALAALEYYLEAAREHRGGLEHILDVAEHSLGELGYWPPPPAREAVALPQPPVAVEPHEDEPSLSETVSLADGPDASALFIGEHDVPTSEVHDVSGLHLAETEPLAPSSSATDGGDDWIEIEEEVVEQVHAADPLAANAGFQTGADGIDDEIREIFLEEMQEEITNLQTAEAAWLEDPSQQSQLTAIRRSFHTLKGSGRLVGASTLGEFAWKVEDMLNRVLDGTIQPHEGVQALVHHAIAALPAIRAALEGDGVADAPISAIMSTAEQLAKGQDQARVADHLGATQTVRRMVKRRVPRVEADADAIPTASLSDIERAADAAATEASLSHAEGATFAEPVLPPIDPVLLEILRSEVAQHLQTIRTTVGRSSGELMVDDGLLRAVHTMHGAIAMVDIPLLMHLLSPLETLLKRLRGAGHALSIEGVGLLGQSADVVDEVMAQFDAAQPRLPDADALIARIAELRDQEPEVQVAHVVFEPQAHEIDSAEELAPAEPSTDSAPESLGTGDDALDFSEALAGFDLHDVAGTPESLTADHASNDIGDEDFAALLASLDETLDLDEKPAASGVEVTDLSQPELPEAAAGEDHGFVAAPSATDAVPHDVTEEEAPAAGMADSGADDLDIEESQTLASDPHPVVDQADVEPVEGESYDYAQPVVEAIDEDAITPVQASDSEPVELAELESADRALAIDTATSEPLEVEAAEAVDVARTVDHAEAVEPVAHEHADATAEAEPAPHVVVPAESGDEIDFSHVDPDLMEVFCEEAHEILDHSDGVLAQWHAEPDESAHVASLLRDLHTLKGGARIAGLSPVGDLTHAIETVLEHPPASGSSQVLIATLEAAFDRLHSLVQRVSQGRPIAYPQAMIDHLQGWSGKAFVAADADADRDAAAPAVVSGSMPQAELPELLPDESEPAADLPSPQQEQIRVRAELLDNLVNHAGEVAIYRSRLEQQVAGYRFNLVELDQTVQRLRSQLRMLEIETEAQIIARYQREHREGGLTVFDPLELDRFSQLQQYSRALAESVSDLVSIQSMLDELTRQAETLLIQQSRVSSELQEGLLRTRMLPFDTMVPNLRRTLRQAAQEQGKNAQLHVEGAHGEMDRNLLERIKAPFEHMLRNAVAHGIESPEERQKAGKPGEGAVRIRVAREATEVVVRVSDDGRGLDREAIRKRAIERGLLREDARPGESELLGLITQPGFSTASEITQLAGRGVGMDVVANEIKQLGGSLAIDSEQGKGTTFVLRLPFTLAVTQAILVRIGEVTFAIPMTSVQGVARISPAELTERLAEPDPAFEYNTERFVIHDLAELLGHTPGYVGDEEQLPLLLTRSGDLRAAIRIDEVIGSREIVVKSVGPQVSSVPGILGATIMGDGSVLIILDLAPLVRHGISRREQRVAEGLDAVEQMPVVEEGRIQPLVMVVDDSITMRKVTGRVLERHEYEVMTAKDGVDALEKLNERVPDLMLLDIEMPRMDGYELATQMKADPRLRRVPIIMITSRTGEKHRQRAFDIGVDRYLGKPYQEAELLTQIGEVLEQRAMEAEE